MSIERGNVFQENFSLRQGNAEWNLCDAAELNMEDALDDQAVILVNEKLLVKCNGKLSGLCLETFTSQDGYTFLEGNWYSPYDFTLRDRIEKNFDNVGEAKIELQEGGWQYMRPKNNDGTFKRAREYALFCPEKLPETIAEHTRKEYRELSKEPHHA